MLIISISVVGWYYSHDEEEVKIEDNVLPLFTLKKAILKQFNHEGKKVYTLTSDYLEHRSEEQGSSLKNPLLHAFDPAKTDKNIIWQVRSDEGFINAEHSELTLKQNVQLQHFDHQTNKETTVLSPHMFVLADGSLVSTQERVTILMPPYRSEGIGFTGRPRIGQFSLNQEVKSSYDVNFKKMP